MSTTLASADPVDARPRRRHTRATTQGWRIAVVTVLALAALWAMPAPARAATITGAITSLTTNATHTEQYDQVALACTWAVPDGSSPGDTFTLQLPSQLRWFGAAAFALKAPDGQTVVTAVAAPSGVVTFTLTDYVRTHPTNVHGDCTFTTQYTAVGTGGDVTLNFTVGSQVVPVVVGTDGPCTQGCPPAHTQAVKSTWWTDATQQQAESLIEAPPTTANASTVTITDTPHPGMAIDCSTVVPAIGRTLDGDGHVVQPGDSARYPAHVVCSSGSLTVTWVGLPAGEYTEVQLTNTITDPTLASYTNAGTVSIDGANVPVESQLIRTNAGGSGIGTPVPTTTTKPPTTKPPTTSPTTKPPTTTAPAITAPPTTTTPPPVGGTMSASTEAAPGSAGKTPVLAYTGSPVLPQLMVAAALLGMGLVALALRSRVQIRRPTRGRS
jgi:Bacterial Ig domain